MNDPREFFENMAWGGRGRGGRGRGRGGPGPWGPGPRRMRRRPAEERTTGEQRQRITAWVVGRLPTDWYIETPQVSVDADEILIVGRLAGVELPTGASADDRSTAEAARINGHREDTREQRIRIAEGRRSNSAARSRGAPGVATPSRSSPRPASRS